MEDQQPGSSDLTTEGVSATEQQPRRRFFRRRTKATLPDEPATESTAEPAAEVADSTPAGPAPKTPVGKAARTARTPVTEQDPTPAESATVAAGADEEKVEASEAEATGAEATGAEATETEATGSEATGADGSEPAGGADKAAADADETGAEPAEPVVLVPHRPAPRGLLVAAALASAVFVGASAFAAAMVQPYLAQRALVETKLNIARIATDAITTLWTYTPEDMTTLADRASVYLGGDFADEYRRYIDAIVEPNKQAQVTNSTQVIGAAVESVSPPSIPTEATALVYTNSVATSPVTKNIPALRYLSYRLTMQRDGGDWRITRMSTITSFDLTPQL